MTDQTDTEQDQPIHYFESFRRAKRNLLFWSVIAFMLPLTRPDEEGDGVDVPTLVGEYDLWLLVTMSLVILCFMMVGFRQATHAALRRNSNVGVDTRPAPLPDLNTEVRNKVADFDSVAKDQLRKISNLRTETAQRARDMRQDARRYRSAAIQQAKNISADTKKKVEFLDTQFKALPAIEHWPGVRRSDPIWIAAYQAAEHGSLSQAQLDELRRAYDAAYFDTAKHNQKMVAEFLEFLEEKAVEIEPTDSDLELLDPKGEDWGEPVDFQSVAAPDKTVLDEAVVASLDKFEAEFERMRQFSNRIYRSDRRFFDHFEVDFTWAVALTAGATAIAFLMGATTSEWVTPGQWLLRLAG